MNLIYELEAYILKMYCKTKLNFLAEGSQKVEHYRQTDRQSTCDQKHSHDTLAGGNSY